MNWLRLLFKRIDPFKGIDPRLRAELRSQRRNIVIGLACVFIAAGMSTVFIPLLRQSVIVIQAASPFDITGGEKPIGSQGATSTEIHAAVQKTTESRRQAVDDLGVLCLAIIGLFMIKYWFTRGQQLYLTRAGMEMGANLSLRLFQKLQRLPITYFNDRRTGAIQSVLTSDVNVYQSAINMVRDSIEAPVKAIGAFVMILIMQPILALIAAVFIPIMAWVIQRNGRRMKMAQRKVQEDISNLNATTQEAIAGTRIIKALGAEDKIVRTHQDLVATTLQSQVRMVKRLAALRPLVELIGAFAIATAVYLCGWLAFAGRLVVADIFAMLFAMDLINQGFRQLGYINNQYNQVRAAADRLYSEVLDVPEEHASATGSKVLPAPTGKIEFQNVEFSYPDGTSALNGVSFTIEPGTSIALVGPSGSGKSTIADLLLRFYDPTKGQILFDGTDLRQLKISWYRAQIGVVPQHTFLFAGSIAENIRLADPDAAEQEIAEATKVAHASGFIEAMPHGIETQLGERGVRLSGGEMQRIAIARAVVRKPPILILDEATSNLDPESEQAVQAALEEIMQGRTTLFIAHRLTTAARADRILVLRRGEIIEAGSHKELMDKGGVYAGMYKAFSSGVLEDVPLV